MNRNRSLLLPALSAIIPLAFAPGIPAQAPATRFAVTHLHTLSQCIGYLYISADRVRFEVVHSIADKAHSFDLARSDIKSARPWTMLRIPQNIVEVKTSTETYHFLLLPDSADLATTEPRQWGIRQAVPISTLIAALQGTAPQTAVATNPGTSTPTSPATSATAGVPTNPDPVPPAGSASVPPGSAPVPVGSAAAAFAVATPPASPVAVSMPSITGAASLPEYIYSPPPGWSNNTYSDGITLFSPTYNTGERCLITMWPFQPAGPDLSTDAGRAFQRIFNTYEPRTQTSDGTPLPTTLIRGTSGQGWDYVILKRGIGKPNGPGGPFESLQGFVLVARLRSNVAVVAGLSKAPLVSSCLGELVGNVWPRFFYSLRFKDWPVNDQGTAMASKLEGTWTTASGGVSGQYQFAANGRYATAAAVQRYSAVSSSQVVASTQAFFGNGSFTVQENGITLTPDDGKGPRETGWLRLEEESRNGGRTWTPVLYLLRVSAVDGKDYEVRYTKVK